MVVERVQKKKIAMEYMRQQSPEARNEKKFDVLQPEVEFWCWWGYPTSQHACGRLCHGYLPDVRARVIDCCERGGRIGRGV
jgi:hypothetical protein